MGLLRRFPGFIILLMISSALMAAPALHAARLEDWPTARVFADHALFLLALSVILGLATMNRVPRSVARYHLVTLLLAFALIPVALAAPVEALVPGLSFGRAYFEMLSCLTTTGASLFERNTELPEPLHFWRALVGWMGGLLVLVTAFSILAPLNLGGFELRLGGGAVESRHSATVEEAGRRIARFTRVIAPIYGGLTGALALALIFAGDRPFIAICHAMSTLSTSGISPVGGLSGGQSGFLGELAIAICLLPAVSHHILGYERRRRTMPNPRDPELELMLITVSAVTLLLFLRSYIGAAEIDRQGNLLASAKAIWGGMFTTLSFLTTTGFASNDWRTMQLWSNMPSPGVILMGVAVMGGGVATTAGGVKLLRIYSLYRQGLREMELLVHPSSLGRRGQGDHIITARGARIAFIFLLLFLIAMALVMIGLAATGLNFETSLTLAIAGLTTTGPLIDTLGGGTGYQDLGDASLAILCAAMIVGRLETLVIVALFNPGFWRG
ncbi:potassium transporter TrkG [Amaricoccus sp.]|uniref:potassium transporter TrkG n=1 Tax=Amaricoccus sp. TaxID=1872485 RepID=UPI0026381E2B|nr:potassium transporter TrkG [uncultured Amaricoccus sp.]